MFLIVSELLSFLAASLELATRARGGVWVPFFVLTPIMLAIPRTARAAFFSTRLTAQWLREVEWRLLALVAISIPGPLWFHEFAAGVQYDRFLHFAAGGFSAQLIVLFLLPFFGNANRGRVLVWAIVIGFVSLFAWEGSQWLSDRYFGTHSFYDFVQPITRDFWEDIFFGFAGGAIALEYAFSHYHRFTARLFQES